ncbi:PP2C-like domain-containing protein CG9801 isoform X2 [Xenia sp. Carnegie-2017]|uniref:PP2C-like domain-containing protein CG9801 isoform X2 n=1 Tax=Xenia sp. Carnegie-2017 TaxID=2897299 RepID=UPI001F035E16|nr:PP2C-like domain-containing protein CG9801 isoform X2 [Xenia sp. Carnegie-2017]
MELEVDILDHIAIVDPEFNSLINVPFTTRDDYEWQREIISSKISSNIPYYNVVTMTTEVLAADTGPDGGVHCLDVEQIQYFNKFHESKHSSTELVAGIANWTQDHRAFGLSQSLYDIDPKTQQPFGEPNADAFAVVARKNNAFMVLADGCGWGVGSFIAARTAVKGCIEYLTNHLHKSKTTGDIIESMLNSFKFAHNCILESSGTITTLCAAVVFKMKGVKYSGLCVVNVGDSLAFIYRKQDGCVQEVSWGSHNPDERDMRQSGGCIGPLIGDSPDLRNLAFSFAYVDEGDIVFLASDGITDNFDPNVLKVDSVEDIDNLVNEITFERNSVLNKPTANDEFPKQKLHSTTDDQTSMKSSDISHIIMKKVIQTDSPCQNEESSAKELCAKLINFVLKQTSEKREFLEKSNLCKKDFEEKKKTIPGKLDHATVVAYEVCNFQLKPLRQTTLKDFAKLGESSVKCSGNVTVEMNNGNESLSSTNKPEGYTLLGLLK